VHHPRWIRFTAYGCLLFLLLASGRGLIPGLCANLRALNDASAATCAASDAEMGPSRACCSGMSKTAPGGKDKGNGPSVPGKKECAFCSLCSARMLPLHHFVLDKPAPVRIGFLPPSITSPISRHAPEAVRGRAPPLTSLAA
jgi:hypothetical protein